jgi:hypothetical protein
MELTHWTVDYGDGPRPVTVPHAWRQDVPVAWEGPAIYRTPLECPLGGWLHFEGVSYAAKIWLCAAEAGWAGGSEAAPDFEHFGIWDAFSVPVQHGFKGEVVVEVTKNGGETYPVREVASGFLPFVYHTFGGIFRPVRLLSEEPKPKPAAPANLRAEGAQIHRTNTDKKATDVSSKAAAWLESRITGDASKITQNEEQIATVVEFRGILTWGWYPEIGHPHPDRDTIFRETDHIRRLGFNLVKFCLWLPPHAYLEELHRHQMWAWIELPLWDPSGDSEHLEKMGKEMERVALQYRHHPNIAFWTLGCELGERTPAGYRQQLVDRIREITRAPFIKDSSGGAEMYGGDQREFGDYYDYHPYCDLPFFPEVVDSLTNGPRQAMPILLGEFNDIDVHRDLSTLAANPPYWASDQEELNEVGVRWQYDLPGVLKQSSLREAPNRNEVLRRSSVRKALFMRRFVQEHVRGMADVAGYVVTGLRDTPISTAGVLDDQGLPRFSADEIGAWNSPKGLFLIPSRRPPWIHGGNRPGWVDPFNHFKGRIFWKVGFRGDEAFDDRLEWDILHFSWSGSQRPKGKVCQGASLNVVTQPGVPIQVGEISWEADEPGGYLLRVRFAGVESAWPFWVVSPPDPEKWEGWLASVEPEGWLADLKLLPLESEVLELKGPDGQSIQFWTSGGTEPMPMWRESAWEFVGDDFWQAVSLREHWERWLPLSTDRALTSAKLDAFFDGEWQTRLRRVDTRTYREHPYLAEGLREGKPTLVTTLRPYGGLGITPRGLRRNPAGVFLLESLRDWISSRA